MYNKSVNMDFIWSKLLKEAPFSASTKKGASFDSMPLLYWFCRLAYGTLSFVYTKNLQ